MFSPLTRDYSHSAATIWFTLFLKSLALDMQQKEERKNYIFILHFLSVTPPVAAQVICLAIRCILCLGTITSWTGCSPYWLNIKRPAQDYDQCPHCVSHWVPVWPVSHSTKINIRHLYDLNSKIIFGKCQKVSGSHWLANDGAAAAATWKGTLAWNVYL